MYVFCVFYLIDHFQNIVYIKNTNVNCVSEDRIYVCLLEVLIMIRNHILTFVSKKNRNKDYGKLITRHGIDFLKGKYPKNEIIISAQHRLESFYVNLGFRSRGDVYLEDDIDHIQMYI